MTHRFPIKEISQQAGLSTATVDRVLNGRVNVSAQTRARVAAAIDELEGQEAQLAAKGRRMFVDIVMEAPARFSGEVRRAVEAELPSLGPGVMRPRFSFFEDGDEAAMIAMLDKALKRGSHGVCLKARDLPGIRAALRRLEAKGIPTVTLVTDLKGSARIAYAGLDNAQAGRTAAYLIAGRVQRGHVLMTKSHEGFQGEVAREQAFASELALRAPGLKLIDASGGAGLNRTTADEVRLALKGASALAGVYSMGGGNGAILDVLSAHGITPEVYVAHDLDRENRQLLRKGQLTYVLHHDLRKDMRVALHQIMGFHGLMPPLEPGLSDVQVITPLNMPEG